MNGVKREIEELVGRRINYLTIIGDAPKRGRTRYVTVQCDCGKIQESSLSCVLGSKFKSCKKCGSARLGAYGESIISQGYFGNLRKGAKARSIDFDITKEEAQKLLAAQDCRCAYSGKSIKLATSERSKNATGSIDRKDSTAGYTPGNIQWVNKNINKMKMDFSENDFLYMIKTIYENRHLQDAIIESSILN